MTSDTRDPARDTRATIERYTDQPSRLPDAVEQLLGIGHLSPPTLVCYALPSSPRARTVDSTYVASGTTAYGKSS